jgi:3-phenylpropionate/cinnamic acid dioxygenase small subunit
LTGADFRSLAPRELRAEIEALFADYLGCLDEERFEDWPNFFVEDCLYKIVPRENFERGLPLATWLSESRGYLLDRVVGIRKTMVYAPRRIRRMISGIRVIGWEGDAVRTRASYAAFETLADEPTRVFNVGEYRDAIVAEGGALKFRERICIFDSLVVPNSLIFPL